MWFEVDGLEGSDRANKAALLLAHERYSTQYSAFVKRQATRLSYVKPQLSRMLGEVCEATSGDLEWVTSQFEDYLKEAVDDTPYSKNERPDILDDIVHTDILDRGDVEGAGLEEALDIPQQDLMKEAQCFRCERAFMDKTGSVVCHRCSDELKKLAISPRPYGQKPRNRFEDADGNPLSPDQQEFYALDALYPPGMGRGDVKQDGKDYFPRSPSPARIRNEQEAAQQTYTEIAEAIERGDLTEKPPFLSDEAWAIFQQKYQGGPLTASKEADADWDDSAARGVGTGLGEAEDVHVAPAEGSMQMVCSLCGFEGTRDEGIAHVQQDHADVLQRQMAQDAGTPTPQQPAYASKTAEENEPAEVQPLPESPGDRFEDHVQRLAESAAARKFSVVDEETIHSISSQIGQSPDDVKAHLIAVAMFGSDVGVNGEVGGDPNPPEGYEEVSVEGVGANNQEAIVPTDLVINKVAEELNMERDLAYNQVRDRFGADLPDKYHAQVTGEIHYYLPTELAGNQQQQEVDPNVGPTMQPAAPIQQPQV